MHRLSIWQRLFRLALICAAPFVVLALTPDPWKVLTVVPSVLLVRLAIAHWVTYEVRCPACKGAGISWRGKGRQHLVCGRCGGYGTVDRYSGRRVWGVGMRGAWSADGKR